MTIQLHRELQHLHFRMSKLNPELKRVYYSRWIEAIAFALISLFVPIFLLQSGLSLPHVILYYLSIYIPLGLFSPIAAKIIEKIGYKHTIIPHPLYAVIFFLLLPQIPQHPEWLIPMGIIKGIVASLYWMSINTLFIQHSTKGHRAREQGVNTAVAIGIKVIAPILGGIIILILGYDMLFYTAAALMLLSLIPIFSTPDYKPTKQFKLKDIFDTKYMNINAGFLGSGFKDIAAGVLFPLLLYFVLKEPLLVGGFKSVMAIIDLLIVIAASTIADKYNDRRIIQTIAPVVALLILALYFANNVLALTILTLSLALTAPFLSMGFIATYYEKTHHKPLTHMVTRELYLTIARVAILVPVFFLADYQFGFIIAAAGTLFYLLV